MSGTQDIYSSAQNQKDDAQEVQSGTEQTHLTAQEAEEEEAAEKQLTPSEKMDRLIRGQSSGFMKKEIERLRKEAAKYRSSSKTEEAKKLELQQKADEIQKELETLRSEHRNLSIIRKLDKAGCIKSELVAKDIPSELDTQEGLDAFIEQYKESNEFLFKSPKTNNVGGTFKTSGAKNLTPSQQMDAYIRAALGR